MPLQALAMTQDARDPALTTNRRRAFIQGIFSNASNKTMMPVVSLLNWMVTFFIVRKKEGKKKRPPLIPAPFLLEGKQGLRRGTTNIATLFLNKHHTTSKNYSFGS